MNKQITLLSTLAASLLMSLSAHAADTAELKVTGIIRPPACTPSFIGGNTVNYGTISSNTLKAGAYTQLSTKEVQMTVSCDAPSKFAYRVTDNRTSSAVLGIAPGADLSIFGLGQANGKNIGGYQLVFSDGNTADGVVAKNITSWGTGGWYVNNAGQVYKGTDYRYSFTNTADVTPSNIKVLTTKLSVTPYINKPENLTLTSDVPLDGSATIEVLYL